MESLYFGFELGLPPPPSEKWTSHAESFGCELRWTLNIWRIYCVPERYRLVGYARWLMK